MNAAVPLLAIQVNPRFFFQRVQIVRNAVALVVRQELCPGIYDSAVDRGLKRLYVHADICRLATARGAPSYFYQAFFCLDPCTFTHYAFPILFASRSHRSGV